MKKGKKRFVVNLAGIHCEVTGSCIFISVKLPSGKKFKFIIDCGLFQEEKYEKFNAYFPFKINEVDFALITHSHIDHIGRLPLASKLGFIGPIYATHDAKTLMKIALQDSCNVLRKYAKKNGDPVLYSIDDVKNTLLHVKGVDFNRPIQVNDNIKVSFFVNGHVPGAAIILVQISDEGYEDINLLFTGDYNDENLFFDVPDLPEWVKELPLTVITEATYGDTVSDEVDYCFIPNLVEATKKMEDIVIPCIALDRMQKELYKVKYMQDNGLIPASYRIGLDGTLAQEYTELYVEREIHIDDDIEDFLPHGLEFIDASNRYNFINSSEPKIVFTTSGMGSFGPAQVHIPNVLQDKAGLVHFTCYLAEGTLGRKLKETADSNTVIYAGKTLIKRGNVKFTQEDSSHAKSNILIQFLQKFKNLKAVIINHGETETKETFKNLVLEKVNVENVEVMDRDRYFRIGSNGLLDNLPSKFQ